MIDIHSHILPAIDDGAETLEESLAMARLAVAGGVTDMVCSSHSAELFEMGPQAALQARVDALQAAVDAAGIPLKLWPGMEIFLTPDTPRHLAEGRAWGLAGGRYVLVEIPYEPWPAHTEQTLFALQVAGYLPILAHPERYVAVQHDPNVLYRLVERGILAQVTTGAFDGHFGAATRRSAITLCEHGLVQILASDSHSAHDRRRLPGLREGRRVLEGLVGDARATAMTTTIPGDVLANQPVTPDRPPTEVARPFLSRLFGGHADGG
jgi:protein-tyrosine phosphatase